MSHNKLRHEKNCLNCGQTVEERYCSNCGQENLQIQDSALHLILHYIQDLFHYDGKVWHTLKNLIIKPGLVAGEYMEGKRMRNLEPVRFYVFASTVFFLILFFVVNTDEWNKNTPPEFNFTKRIYNLNQEKKFLNGHSDTLYINLLTQHLREKQDSIEKLDPDSNHNSVELDLSTPIFSDTAQGGWLGKMIEKRAEHRRKEMEEKHSGDVVSAATDFFNEVFHKLPLLLFLSMPFFALYLKVLYIGSTRKRYVEHFIFSIYHYSFFFMITSLFLIISFGIEKLEYDWMSWFGSYSPWVFILYLGIYLWNSMGRFYGDRWYFRLAKYLTLMLLLFTTMLLLFLLIFFLTVFF